MEKLIDLKDGFIKEIATDLDSYSGCETCDYGSSYITDMTVYFEFYRLDIKVSQMYDYAISQDYLIKLFLLNVDTIRGLKESEFVHWITAKLKADFPYVDAMEFDYNAEGFDIEQW